MDEEKELWTVVLFLDQPHSNYDFNHKQLFD